MADQETTEVLIVHLEYLRKAADETNTHLKTLNGRMGAVETRTTVLETRADDVKAAGRNWGAGAGAAGGFIGGLIAGFLGRGGGQ